jgi:hypothetical protein
MTQDKRTSDVCPMLHWNQCDRKILSLADLINFASQLKISGEMWILMNSNEFESL